MSSKDAYDKQQREEFGALIDTLGLDDMQKRFLRSRWLDQIMWLEGKAAHTQRRHNGLRLTTVVGAVLVPALVGLQTVDGAVGDVAQVGAIVVSVIVAVSAAIEQFYRFGERWRHYRSTVEQLKSEGWLYFERAGPYAGNGASHAALFPSFAQRVEEMIQTDVKVFVTEVTADRDEDGNRPPAGDA